MKALIEVDLSDGASLEAAGNRMIELAGGLAGGGAKAAPGKKKKADAAADKGASEKGDAPAGPTRDEVRARLKEYAALEGKDAAIRVLKDHGAASIGELSEERFAEVVAACD